MQIHNLKRVTKNKKSTSVGRGGKRGKTSGRGTKGQSARAGNKKRPEMRDLIKKIPKLRGYRFAPVIKKTTIEINLLTLEKVFDDGSVISPATLKEKGLIKKSIVGSSVVKILAKGKITKKLTIEGCQASAGAKTAIEKAGGSIKN